MLGGQCGFGVPQLVERSAYLNFTGENAMLEALKTVLGKMHQDALPPESVDVFCYSKHMRGLIRNLVYQLVAECIEMRLKPVEQEKRRRFKAIRIGQQTHGLFFERRGVSVQKLENSVDFYSCISTNKLMGAANLVMGKTDEPHPPEIVDAYASEGLIQFFFEDCDDGFNIYILDEANRIEVYRQCSGDKDEMVHGVNRFYTSAQDALATARTSSTLTCRSFTTLCVTTKASRRYCRSRVVSNRHAIPWCRPRPLSWRHANSCASCRCAEKDTHKKTRALALVFCLCGV